MVKITHINGRIKTNNFIRIDNHFKTRFLKIRILGGKGVLQEERRNIYVREFPSKEG